MQSGFYRGIGISAAAFLVVGCVGQDTILFATKTNVGIDIDTKPPTAEITIARREIVISPTYEKGKKPSVLGSFRFGSEKPFNNGISGTFAGGAAAIALAKKDPASGITDKTEPGVVEGIEKDAQLCLAKKPKGRYWNLRIEPDSGIVRPFVFGTDTSLGLKIAWSGLAAALPDSLKLGYNRKEMVVAGLSVVKNHETNKPNCKYIVRMTPFIATIDHSSSTAKPLDTKLRLVQYFATGKAAVYLALRKEIRDVLIKKIIPDAKVKDIKVDNKSTSRKTILCWLKTDNANKTKQLKEYAKNNTGRDIDVLDIVHEKGKDREQLRQDFIKEKDIKCPSGG